MLPIASRRPSSSDPYRRRSIARVVVAPVLVAHLAGGWAGYGDLAARDVAEPTTVEAGAPYVVAHNAGSSVESVRAAVAAGADVIEIDVRSLYGVLVSSHAYVVELGGLLTFDGPTVEEVWAASAGADAVLLDLKESSNAFLSLVAAFLVAHRGERAVIVSSRDDVRDALGATVPEVTLLRSVADRSPLAHLVAGESACRRVAGVSVREDLLDAASMARLREVGLVVFAWTVDEPARAVELVDLGVTGIITGNVDVLASLGGPLADKRSLQPSDTIPLVESTASCP